jgi:hypothetical protein
MDLSTSPDGTRHFVRLDHPSEVNALMPCLGVLGRLSLRLKLLDPGEVVTLRLNSEYLDEVANRLLEQARDNTNTGESHFQETMASRILGHLASR